MMFARVDDRVGSCGRPSPDGLARSLRLARVFPLEQGDPDTFYRALAADTVAQIGHYIDLQGLVVLDVGGGGGYFSEAFWTAGARSVLIEPDAADGPPTLPDPDRATPEERHRLAIWPGRLVPRHTVAADGYRLPFPEGIADLTFSSNVLEHVAHPERLIGELLRVTRPGGLLYLSFTVWYSPWGGHETAPWHYLGGARAARRYQARFGRPPKNLFGTSLFARHVGDVLRMVDQFNDKAELLDARPRYYPRWLRWVIRVPGLRELLTWNLLLVIRRQADGAATPSAP